MQPNLSAPLHMLVERQYSSAKAASNLQFSSTELTVIRTTSGLPFQLRYCPALAEKPTTSNDEQPKAAKPDPFASPSRGATDLFIADLPSFSSTSSNPSHFLVLNKFPVIPQHFILATTENKPQTHLLEQEDLEATYACIRAWEEDRDEKEKAMRRLFAFFNSGPHSGASQPHRHLQFLPVEEMRRDGDEGSGWDVLMDSLSAARSTSTRDASQPGVLLENPLDLPFAHFAARLPLSPSAQELHQTYTILYKAAVKSAVSFNANKFGDLELHDTAKGDSAISYNLGMTSSAMMLCPRRQEGGVLIKEDGTEVGYVALNGTILAGTSMVKLEEEWELLKREQWRLDVLLEAIGIPRKNRTSEQKPGMKM